MPPYYPVFLQLAHKNCLVVGGGSVANRKVEALLECQAQVEVVSLTAHTNIQAQAAAGKLRLTLREFREEDVKNRFLVFAATGDAVLNQRIATLCHQEHIWLNAVDDPPHCDFYVPALLRRGEVTIAVSSAGQSPLLAAKIRDEIANLFPEEIGVLAQILGEVREKITASCLSHAEKKALYATLLQQNFLTALQEGKEDEVRENVKQCISSWLD